jgi:hypothetical protein
VRKQGKKQCEVVRG